MVLMTFYTDGLKAQTLAAGDIAMIGYTTDSPDGFTFIALKDLPAGETVYFTEEGWNGTVWNCEFEPHLQWVIPTGITMGTIVSVVENTPDVFTVTGSANGVTMLNPSGSANSFNISAGDQILVYQSSTGARASSVTFITGVHGDYNSSNYDTTTTWSNYMSMNNTSESVLPTGLTNRVNAISLYPSPGPELDNSKYTGPLTGKVSEIRDSINNPANWTGTNNSGTIDITSTTYGVTNVTPDVVTPVSASISAQTNVSCNGGSNGSLTAKATDGAANFSYFWSNGAATSNTSSTTHTTSSLSAGTYTVTITDNNGATSTASSTITQPATTVAASISTQTNVSCNGGTDGQVTASATGGISPYTYAWNTGATTAQETSLGAGTYSVTITDNNGCTSSSSATITQPTALNASTTVDQNVNCNGGADGGLSGSATGGTNPYTFLWSNGGTTSTQTGMSAGTYTVTITDNNGCTATSSKTLTSPTAVNAGEIQ